MREAIEAAGARVVYLPPYSPDLNPIELAFAKLKALLRKAGERTVEGLWELIGRLMDEFTPKECQRLLHPLRVSRYTNLRTALVGMSGVPSGALSQSGPKWVGRVDSLS